MGIRRIDDIGDDERCHCRRCDVVLHGREAVLGHIREFHAGEDFSEARYWARRRWLMGGGLWPHTR